MIAEVMWVHSHFPDKEALNDYTCAIYNAFYSIGDFSGPILGNLIYLNVGFNETCNFVAILCIIPGILYILLCKESEIDVSKSLVIWRYSELDNEVTIND